MIETLIFTCYAFASWGVYYNLYFFFAVTWPAHEVLEGSTAFEARSFAPFSHHMAIYFRGHLASTRVEKLKQCVRGTLLSSC